MGFAKTGNVPVKANRNFGCSICVFAVLSVVTILVMFVDVELLQQVSVFNDLVDTISTRRTSQTLKCYDERLSYKYPVRTEPEGLKLAWIMSFPNSGTGYTYELVREATKTESASNYADETPAGEAGYNEPVFTDMPNGPFWVQAEDNHSLRYSKPTEYALTKTHCGLRCTMCPPEKYAETTYSFRSKCFATKWMNMNATTGTGERAFSSYDATDRLTKAIHMIRDPFDNIVSRYHFEREIPGRIAAQYSKTRNGFRSYCKVTDNLHQISEKRMLFLDDNLMDLMKDVPCHADFFRYIEWHNLAFVTTRDLEVSTYVLHFDWYTTRFQETVNEILNFLDLPMHDDGQLIPFTKERSSLYRDYYTVEERRAVAKAFKFMASPDTWSHIQQYLK